jgi:hypothetical protein
MEKFCNSNAQGEKLKMNKKMLKQKWFWGSKLGRYLGGKNMKKLKS